MNTIIHAYNGGRDREVANLILSIQNGEAGLSLSVEDQPDLLDIASTYRDGGSCGRAAFAAFIRDLRDLTEPIRFEVQSIIADNDRSVVIGELASRVKSSAKIIATDFAIILSVA